MKIIALDVRDIRFPTSLSLDGSDAMHTSPDYSCAYVTLETDSELTGCGLTFTNGRGTEVVVAAVRAFAPFVVGRTLEEITADMRGFWRSLASEDQLRWLGPEKGVIHLATGAIVNAVWDLWAKAEGKPLFRLLADLEPQQIVDAIDFRYIDDALSEVEALELLTAMRPGRAQRLDELERLGGYPAYTTSAGWLGYSEEKIVRLAQEAAAAGFTHMKMKVGQDVEADARRAALIREAIGADGTLMMDANQYWGVNQAIEAMQVLGRFDPWWIEEPTSPDDVLGHARIRREINPIRVATGEHVQNRVIFKQLMQAGAIDFCQIDACRLGGVNEVLAVLLMAAKFGVPVCPHAGGVGLCELVQHLSIFDFVAVSGTHENRVTEFVDHLHEHFEDPCVVRDGRYVLPSQPGYSAAMLPESVAHYSYPDGGYWAEEAASA
jgi:L-fuconate dehydratase